MNQTNKRNQQELFNQMSKKQDLERQKIQQKMEQEKATRIAELEYLKKIENEKEKGRKMVKNFDNFNELIMEFFSWMSLENKDHFN